MGLNSDYNVTRGNILIMRPLPFVPVAYGLVIQEEKQREMQAPHHLAVEHTSLNVNTHPNKGRFEESKGKFEDKKIIFCEYCKKKGHTAAKCYKLVGFPKDFKFSRPRRFAANVVSEEEPADVSEAKPSGQLNPELYNQFIKLMNSFHDDKAHSTSQAFTAHMAEDRCVLQDLSKNKSVELGKRRGGLYITQNNHHSSNNSVVQSSVLSHDVSYLIFAQPLPSDRPEQNGDPQKNLGGLLLLCKKGDEPFTSSSDGDDAEECEGECGGRLLVETGVVLVGVKQAGEEDIVNAAAAAGAVDAPLLLGAEEKAIRTRIYSSSSSSSGPPSH
ncbi:unnamed protein product [Cuscuta campestris]|uniref:Retrotransposon gag domain-containing protein n=1 Tax=Cuscuta campestris TaxID=132261 RepID=A0A484MUA3_9ASTE|nr:unnamed protein product [Cuscuta campestris]